MVILSHNLPFILIEFNFKVLFRLLKFNAKNKSGNTFYYLLVYVPFKGFDGRRAGSIRISVLNVICCTQKGVFLNTCWYQFVRNRHCFPPNLIQYKRINCAIKIHNKNSILKTIGSSNNGE